MASIIGATLGHVVLVSNPDGDILCAVRGADVASLPKLVAEISEIYTDAQIEVAAIASLDQFRDWFGDDAQRV